MGIPGKSFLLRRLLFLLWDLHVDIVGKSSSIRPILSIAIVVQRPAGAFLFVIGTVGLG